MRTPRPLASAGRIIVAFLTTGAAWACGTTAATEPAPASCDGVQLIVAASDYSSSVVCGAPRCELSSRTTGEDLGKDPQLATSGGRTFFINRTNDLLFELDPICGTPIARFSVREDRATNPHDVAVAPDGTLFVTLFDAPRIDILEDGKVTGNIDLSGYDDDRNPQADAIRIVPVNGVAKAFVTLERLDDHTYGLPSRQESWMLRIDVASRKVEETIVLAGRNPYGLDERNGQLFLPEPGNFDSATDDLAGIERFDTATSTTRLLVREVDLGGSAAEVAVTDGCGVAIVDGPAHDVNPTSLVTFDPDSGKVFTTAQAPVLGPTPGLDLHGLAWRGNLLYVGDRRRGASGYPVHIFERDPGTCNLHETTKEPAIILPQSPVALRPAAR